MRADEPALLERLTGIRPRPQRRVENIAMFIQGHRVPGMLNDRRKIKHLVASVVFKMAKPELWKAFDPGHSEGPDGIPYTEKLDLGRTAEIPPEVDRHGSC